MSIKPPPRLVVRSVHTHAATRRRRTWMVLAWLGSVVLAAVAAYVFSQRAPLSHGLRANNRTLTAENESLKQELATLRQARAVDTVATKRLQSALADRDEQISGLRADLAFYSRLVGGAQRQGLQLQAVHVERVAQAPHAWNLTLTLTQNSSQRNGIQGTVNVTIEGIRDHKVETLTWQQLTSAKDAEGLDFRFKYFQQLQSTMVLPKGFTPNRLQITVAPKGAADFSKTVSWADAQRKTETNDVQPE